jgi:response regulator RpfG family c-di-GMP phosphodiesterase
MEKTSVLSKNNPKIYLCEVKRILVREKKYFDMIHAKLAGIPDDFGETLRHSQRVANFCYLLAEFLGWSDEGVTRFVESGDTHDVGKIILPKEALHSENFGPEELSIVQRHPRAGYLLLLSWKRGMQVANPALLHHTHQGKRSYPKITEYENSMILKEDRFRGRLLSMADVFDTLAIGRLLVGIMPIPLNMAWQKMTNQFKKEGDEKILEFLFAQYPSIKKYAERANPQH